MDGLGFTILGPMTPEVDPPAKITGNEVVWDWKTDNRLVLYL